MGPEMTIPSGAEIGSRITLGTHGLLINQILPLLRFIGTLLLECLCIHLLSCTTTP